MNQKKTEAALYPELGSYLEQLRKTTIFGRKRLSIAALCTRLSIGKTTYAHIKKGC